MTKKITAWAVVDKEDSSFVIACPTQVAAEEARIDYLNNDELEVVEVMITISQTKPHQLTKKKR